MEHKGEFEHLWERIKNLERIYFTSSQAPQEDNKTGIRFLKFTEKEILQMPKSFRKTFRAQGCTAHIRKRFDARYKCSYEVRYYRDGYAISCSAKTIDEVKKRFIEKLQEVLPQNLSEPISIPVNFDKFSIYWLENFHKPKVNPKTYYNNLKLYERHIKKVLSDYSLAAITPILLKNLFEKLPGKGKTADDVRCLLNQIFKSAVKHGKIKVNPLDLIFYKQHERQTGKELTREEELKLLNACKGSTYAEIFAVMLYTGLRPNEVKTAQIKDDFIIAVNSKGKTKNVEYKKIPICSFLREYIGDSEYLCIRSENRLRLRFNSILPDHTLKDLRKTFNTRCTELKINDTARKMFMGHSLGKLRKTYTGNLDKFLILEAKNFEKWYTFPND